MKNTSSLVVCIFAASLSACIPSKVFLVPDAASVDAVPPAHGTVIAQVVDASGFPYPVNHLTLAPQDVFESDENQFKRIDAEQSPTLIPGVSSSRYIGVIESGTYSLSDLYSYHIFGEYYYQDLITATPAFGTFEVRPNQLTNLGTILFYAKPDGDQYSEVLARNDSFEDGPDLLRARYPAIARDLTNLDAPLRWNRDDFAEERFSNYLSVVQNPTAFNEVVEYEDEVVVLAKAGAILRRDAFGDWTLDAVESDLNLLSHDRNSHGDEIVAGEFGTIFVRESGSAGWSRVRPPDPFTSIPAAAISDDRTIFVYLQTDTNVTLYSGSISGVPDWRAVMQYLPGLDWLLLDQQGEVVNMPDRAKLENRTRRKISKAGFANVSGQHFFIENGRVFDMNYDSLTVSKLDLGFKVSSIAPFKKFHVATTNPSIWDLDMDTHVGESWSGEWWQVRQRKDACPDEDRRSGASICMNSQTRRYTSMDFLGYPLFVSKDTGYAIMKRSVSGIARSQPNTPILAITSDGGASWVEYVGQDDFPKFANLILPSTKPGFLTVVSNGSTGKIYDFEIEEKTFELRWEPNTF